jgi:hypothetical protein
MSFLASLFGSKKEEAKPVKTNLNVTNEQLEILGMTREQYEAERNTARVLAEANRLNAEAEALGKEAKNAAESYNTMVASLTGLGKPKSNAKVGATVTATATGAGARARSNSLTVEELMAMPQAEFNAYMASKLGSNGSSGGRRVAQRKTRRRRNTRRKTTRRRRAH